MCVLRNIAITMVVAVAAGVARAGEITFSYHQASGSGTANLFDGGPPFSDSGSISGGLLPRFTFSAIDRTRPGSLGASAGATGASEVGVFEDRLAVRVRLGTSYIPSFFGGGDNPGGMAEGSISSVIEFIMPTDELNWSYALSIDNTNRFDGSSSVIFENVTQSQTLLTLTSKTAFVETTLLGQTGDVMRITTMMSGSGSTPPSSTKGYFSTMEMRFTIPEPTTILLLALGVIPFTTRKRPQRR